MPQPSIPGCPTPTGTLPVNGSRGAAPTDGPAWVRTWWASGSSYDAWCRVSGARPVVRR